MSKRIDFSIIIPNFNSGKLLDITLKSIFSVSCYYNFEVMIMDNVSEDNPLKILEFYPKGRVFFFSEKDNGIYDAMNKGIKLARGNWLIFLGAGDELLIDNVNRISFDEGLRLIYGNVYLVQKKMTYGGEFTFFKLMKKNISHQAVFYHSSIFDDLGIFDTRFKIASDYVFNLGVFSKMRPRVKYYPLTFSHFLGNGVSDNTRDNFFQDNKLYIINKIGLLNFNFYNIFSIVRYNIYYLKKYILYRIG